MKITKTIPTEIPLYGMMFLKDNEILFKNMENELLKYYIKENTYECLYKFHEIITCIEIVDENTLLIGSILSRLYVFDLKSRKIVKQQTSYIYEEDENNDDKSIISAIARQDKEQFIIGHGYNAFMSIYNIETNEVENLPETDSGIIGIYVLSEDLVIAVSYFKIHLFDWKEKKLIVKKPARIEGEISSSSILPNGNLGVTTDCGYFVQIDTKTLKQVSDTKILDDYKSLNCFLITKNKIIFETDLGILIKYDYEKNKEISRISIPNGINVILYFNENTILVSNEDSLLLVNY